MTGERNLVVPARSFVGLPRKALLPASLAAGASASPGIAPDGCTHIAVRSGHEILGTVSSC